MSKLTGQDAYGEIISTEEMHVHLIDFNNKYLSDGYKVEASSCNSKYYKSILILEEA